MVLLASTSGFDLRKADRFGDMGNGRNFIGGQRNHLFYAALSVAALGLCAAHGGQFPTVESNLRAQILLRVSPGPQTGIFGGSRYPWHREISTTVFWPGEPGNMRSSFDPAWVYNARLENPFFFALPYADCLNGHTRPEAASVVPWFKSAFTRDGQSVLKGRWIEIRHGNKVAYAAWEDVGPFQTDHWQYVFGNERPRPNRNHDAGLDVSPAVRDYLGLNGIDSCDWRFVDRPLRGPWVQPSGNLFASR